MEVCSFYYDKGLICHIKINSVLQSKIDKKYRMEDNDGRAHKHNIGEQVIFFSMLPGNNYIIKYR